MLKTADFGKGGVGVKAKLPKADTDKPAPVKTAKKTSVSEFARQVRTEVGRITWPTRKETGITTLMVFLMVLFCAIFFLVTDQIIIWVVRAIIGLGA